MIAKPPSDIIYNDLSFFSSRFPFIQIESDPITNTVVFKRGNESYTVEELLAQLIQNAHELAELYAGNKHSKLIYSI